MKASTKFGALMSTGAALCLAAGTAMMVAGDSDEAIAHKAKHTPEQLEAFHEVFMEQVRLGDRLFHGDAEAQEQLGVKLSNTGMACAMRSEEHTSELQSLMRISYAVFCLKKKRIETEELYVKLRQVDKLTEPQYIILTYT